MILADSSAWVEFLRGTGSAQHLRLRQRIAAGDVATTDAVLMEILAGARGGTELEQLRRTLAGCHFVAVEGPADYEAAAAVFRHCRAAGVSPRRLTDCLIAAVAIRADLEVLHRDRDFDAIAAHTELRVAPPR